MSTEMSYLKQAKEIQIRSIDVTGGADEQAEWQFKPVEIPRLDRTGVDVWMVGTRLDKPGTFQFWFVDAQHNANERSSIA